MKSVDKLKGHDTRPRLVRDRGVILLYVALGTFGYLLNGLGSVLVPLQRQLHVSRSQVAYYPSLFALALLVVGLAGGGLIARLGHRMALRIALAALVSGAALLGSPLRPLTLVGAGLIGSGGALLVQVVPSALTERYPGLATAAIGEANAVSSSASVLAPILVAAAMGAGADWRVGYLLPILPVALGVLFLLEIHHQGRSFQEPGAAVAQEPGVGLEPGPLPGRWLDVLLAVSVEFCLVFWAADAFKTWHDAGPGAAPALAGAFLVGMAVARAGAARITTGRHPLDVIIAACGVAGVGFCAFWALPNPIGAAAGLLVMGLGVAMLYPVALARAVAAWPHARDRASARAALASGLAIGVSPMILARLADAFGLHWAYLIVPILLGGLAAHAAIARRRFAGR